MRHFFGLLCVPSVVAVFAIGHDAGAADRLVLPKGPAPQYAIAEIDKAGRLTLQSSVQQDVPEYRSRFRLKDGKKIREKYLVYIPRTVINISRMRLADVEFFNANGEKIDAENAQDRIGKRKIVLVSKDGKPVDPFYLKILQKSTLIIVVKKRPRANQRNGK